VIGGFAHFQSLGKASLAFMEFFGNTAQRYNASSKSACFALSPNFHLGHRDIRMQDAALNTVK
jgi:hypothetical protein